MHSILTGAYRRHSYYGNKSSIAVNLSSQPFISSALLLKHYHHQPSTTSDTQRVQSWNSGGICYFMAIAVSHIQKQIGELFSISRRNIHI